MYVACLNLEDKKVTIVGGGKVAYRKALALSNQKCHIDVIAPYFIADFKTLHLKVNCINKYYEEKDCKDSFLVIAATNNKQINEAIGLFCKHTNKLCNVVDDKALSSFTVPASFSRGDLTLAVSTNGASPSLAVQIKEELALKYDATYEERLIILKQLRTKLLQCKGSKQEKKQILNNLATLDIKELKAYQENYFKEIGGVSHEVCKR